MRVIISALQVTPEALRRVANEKIAEMGSNSGEKATESKSVGHNVIADLILTPVKLQCESSNTRGRGRVKPLKLNRCWGVVCALFRRFLLYN